MSDQKFQIVEEPTSAPGDFYVESNCCIACGVPQHVAPDLVGWTDEKYPQCYWIKQPSTPEELERAFAIFDGQEVGCHRYAGSDPKIKVRVGSENCGPPLPWPSSSAPKPVEGAQKKRPPIWSKKWRRKR